MSNDIKKIIDKTILGFVDFWDVVPQLHPLS